MERYSVVLNGFAHSEEYFRARMMRSGMKLAQIERVIEAVPCVLKRQLTLAEAQALEGTFRDAGGVVEVRGDLDGDAGESPPGLPALDDPLAAPEVPPPALDPIVTTAAAALEPVRVEFRPVRLRVEQPPATGAPSSGLDGDGAAGREPALAPHDPSVPPAAAEAPPAIERPPAQWKQANPWVARGVGLGVLLVIALVASTCIGKYQTLERQHAFERIMNDELEQELNLVVRRNGVARPEDVHEVIARLADRAQVEVAVSDLIHVHVDIVRSAAEDGAGTPVCVAANHDEIAWRLPPVLQPSYGLRLRRCELPPWLVGFAGEVTARWGPASRKLYVEHYAFVNAFEPGE